MIGGSHQLAVDDRSREGGLAHGAIAVGHQHGMVDAFPQALGLSAAQVVVDRLPGGGIVWQPPPGLATAQRIANCVDQLGRRRVAGVPARQGIRYQIGNCRPLSGSQISRVGSASALRHRISSCWATPHESDFLPRRNSFLKHYPPDRQVLT